MASNFNLDQLTEEERTSFQDFQAKVEGTNISPQTLLATDYLNHFNEIVMILEMVPDMPDILEEAREWQPKTYQEFVGASTFSDRDLAVEAYDHVPPVLKNPFEKTITQIDNMVATTIDRLDGDIQSGDMDILRINAEGLIGLVRRLIDHASGIIHGSLKTMDQSEIDDMLAMGGCGGNPAAGAMAQGGPCGAASQASIDALFGGDDVMPENPEAKPKAGGKPEGTVCQADIDALFD